MKFIIVFCVCLLVYGCTGRQQETTIMLRPPAVIDSQSGASLYLYDNGQIITAKSKNGGTLWSVDVIKNCGAPAVGEPKVRSLTIRGGIVNVAFGKHDYATVDLKSGQIACQGAD
jgi:hypothetical protein